MSLSQASCREFGSDTAAICLGFSGHTAVVAALSERAPQY